MSEHTDQQSKPKAPANPFEKGFRVIDPGANMQDIPGFVEDFGLTEADLHYLQSKEWAERMRPMYQWQAKLKERGLYKSYVRISAPKSIEGQLHRYDRLCQFFEAEAPDLLDIFKLYEECTMTHDWGKWNVDGRQDRL